MSIVTQATSFDQIKRVRTDGSEYWSARDLMSALGYPHWQHFEPVIDRAMAAARNQGFRVDDLFTVNLEKTSGRPRQDYRLSRFAAYLVAMNGDPRKPEIAAAQAYFAIRTREAEVNASAQADLTSLDGIAQLAQAAQAAVELARAAQEKVAELAPKAEHTDLMRQADGQETITDVLNRIKAHAAGNYPGVRVVRDDVFDLAGDLGLIIRGNTVRHNQPTARAIGAGWVVPADASWDKRSGGKGYKTYARLTHKGAGRLWDAALNNIKAYGTVRAPKKELI